MQPSSSEMEAVQMENPQTKGPVKRLEKQTTCEDDARWYAIRESLMKFRGADPLQPHLVKLFDIVCQKKKYLSRRELRLECKHFPGLKDSDKELLCDKAVKKLSNVMKNAKW